MPKSSGPRQGDIFNVFFVLVGLAIILAVNYVVDPFRLNGRYNLGLQKKGVVFGLNYWNWKLAEYNRRRDPNILLGDSRMVNFPEEWVNKATGQKFYNFAYEGGTLADSIDTFWYAAKRTDLKQVYININFNQLNDVYYHRNRTREAIDLLEKPLRYYSSPMISRASVAVVLNHWSEVKADPMISRTPAAALLNHWPEVKTDLAPPPVSKDAFWQYNLNVTARLFYEKYEYPQKLLSQLRKVVEHCRKKNIQLVFIYLPTHIDLQNRVDDFNLRKQYNQTKSELSKLAKMYDYDYANKLTRNKTHFNDPYHINYGAIQKLIKEVFAGDVPLARITGP